MELSSSAVDASAKIAQKYTKDGDNISPPLSWSELPRSTRELALLFETITPQTEEPQLLWLVYGISAERGGLPEGFQHKAEPQGPEQLRQGKNALGNVGYDGPIGTVGRRYRYRFRLLALDEPLGLDPGVDQATFARAAAKHIIGQASLEIEWLRPRP